MKNEASEKPQNINARDAVGELEQLLKLPRELAHERVLTWIRGGLHLITPGQVETAVKKNVQVVHLLFNHIHLGHPLVKPLAQTVFKIHWHSVSFYLTDARKLYSILAANPQIAKTLDSQEGRNWIDTCCLYGYATLYNYTWF